jgi:hypothetical protein
MGQGTDDHRGVGTNILGAPSAPMSLASLTAIAVVPIGLPGYLGGVLRGRSGRPDWDVDGRAGGAGSRRFGCPVDKVERRASV